MILDTDDYLRSCHNHLSSIRRNPDGTVSPYYQKSTEYDLQKARDEILDILKDAHDKEIITNDEFEAMDPTHAAAGRFYEIFKVHKLKPDDPAGTIPPERPIVSGSGSITEKISHYVQHHIKALSMEHPAYLQDTPDLLRALNELEDLPDGAVIATVDVTALYTNTPGPDAVEAVRKKLETREDTDTVPTDFICKLLDCVLRHNIFEHDGQLYQQLIGLSMGTRCAPNVSDIFMSFIDEDIKKKAAEHSDLLFYKRFLDDILMIFVPTSPEKLHEFLADINTIHHAINFTMTHTRTADSADCGCAAVDNIPFLDCSISVAGGRIETDLYRKPTDRNGYLLPQSCHQPAVFTSIPYSLAYRIQRICSCEMKRDQRMDELKEMLLQRNYPRGVINAAIEKAKAVPRLEALKRVEKSKQKSDRQIMVCQYDPRLPSVSQIMKKHHRVMCQNDPHCASVYPKPPMIAYRRPKNLREHLIKSRVPVSRAVRPRRQQRGFRRCNKCNNCPFATVGRTAKAFKTNTVVQLPGVDCTVQNCIYLVSCLKCSVQYVGKCSSGKHGDRQLKHRISEHRGTIVNEKVDKAVGEHFNSRGHQLSDFSYTVLEVVRNSDPEYLKEREALYIRKFDTKRNGLNKNY